MKLLIFVFVLVTTTAFAQFDARKDVSQNFASFGEMRGDDAKKALLHQAVTSAMEQFSKDLGFDFNDYQSKLNVNFQTYYEQKLEDQKEVSGSNVTLTPQEAYKQRQFEFFNYSQHLDLLKSYTFNTVSRDAQDHNKWNAQISLSVDSVKLQRLLRRTLQSDNTKFSKMWLIVETNIHSFKWSDLGLEREDAFTQALALAWKDWWMKNLPANFDEVEICLDDCMNYLESWQRSSRQKAFNPNYSDGVWAQVSYDLFPHSNNSPQFPSYKWENRMVFTDINTKKVLGSLSTNGQSRSLRGGDLTRLNSTLASQMFASSAGKFNQTKSFLEQVVKLNQVGQMNVVGHQHMGDVLALKDLIKTRGSNLGLEIELDSFSQNSATLIYFYQGEEKAFHDLLNRINELKSSKAYELKTHYESKGPLVELKAI